LQKKNEEDRYWAIRQAGLLTTIPVLLAAAPIIGLLIGRWIDRKLDTDPIFSIAFLIIGFVAGARQVVRVVKLAGKEQAKDRGKQKDNGRGV
jgi:F0F1-type ATP synthase assembly protein I